MSNNNQDDINLKMDLFRLKQTLTKLANRSNTQQELQENLDKVNITIRKVFDIKLNKILKNSC